MPIKVTEDYYDYLMKEKTDEYSEKYEIPYRVVADIITEGWGLACAYYENKQGKVKEYIIREQYPKLFEKAKFDILNTAIVKDIIGNQYCNIHDVSSITNEKGNELLEKHYEEIQKKINHHESYMYGKDFILSVLNNTIRKILKEEGK